MRYLIILIALTIATTAQGQDTVKIPTPVAKRIVKELVSCDSAKAVLDLTKEELALTNTKVVLKDSLLSNAGLRITNLDGQLNNQKQISNSYNKLFEDTKQQYSNLSKEFSKYKVKSRFKTILSGAIIGSLAYLYFTK